ncbi:MAG: sulfite exporter TauE/SafE family protein [bacterium]|nr:sulfite exporter TauE/SafE family protein [bacterium]MXV90421.1 sulfite exporter TauE/SafE family protein [Acidimicrobiia bacterium]MYC44029.1 sulfite exporter TauE/SafE family protein [Acidimicrobiia bacterium]MYI20632.1 sulfite exporter TauE/SafE family protein [Acidimicrobiia bacterium]
MLTLSTFEIAAAVAVMAVGAAVQGSVGFGLNVVAAPILIQINPDLVPGPLLAAALVMSLMVARRDRSGINRPALTWALAGRLPGAAVGVFLLVKVFSDWSLAVFLASVILVGATLSVAPIRLPQGRPVIALGGFVSGVAGTTTGVGGPPMALALQHIPPRQLRGTMSVYFLVGASFSLVLLAAWGQFGARHLVAVGILVPGQLLGYVLSGRLVPVLERGYTRPALLVISVAAALSVLIRALI